ncbi:MAG: tRNA (guanine(9)-N(1))-methyltransferase [Vezdaea aestivalis]|nr:MAG: tRNA (guanine(9)-N(1))-methyltransferase [Vezdaea aestivalis]
MEAPSTSGVLSEGLMEGESNASVKTGLLLLHDGTSSARDQRLLSSPPRLSPIPQSSDLPDTAATITSLPVVASDPSPLPLSKNQLKKQLKAQKWEASRSDRKKLRKERSKARRARVRQSLSSQDKNAIPARGRRKAAALEEQDSPKAEAWKDLRIVLDCGFEELMTDRERVSLAGQVTRAYSDVRAAGVGVGLVVAGFEGGLKERFEGLLEGTHRGWRGARFFEEGGLKGALEGLGRGDEEALGKERGEVVYLTAEAEHTLDKVDPRGTYIVGGLVDRNRHKGICQRKAEELGIRTAKLPIGEYLQMKSRKVLATNHVVEILVRWCVGQVEGEEKEKVGWGEVLEMVIPGRKGGVRIGKGDDEEGDRIEEGGHLDKEVGGDGDPDGGKEQERIEGKEANGETVRETGAYKNVIG